MNPEKAEKLFSLMRKYGVEHFKNEDLEIKMGVELSIVKDKKQEKLNNTSKKGDIDKKSIPLQAAPPVENTIPHHVNEVAQLLKLSDNDLVDRLFPEQGVS